MRFTNLYFAELSPAELERLACLAEEMAEALQCISKIERHGYRSRHPAPGSNTNRIDLERELGQVAFWVRQMTLSGDLDAERMEKATEAKAANVGRYLHHHEIRFRRSPGA